jgi:predicted DNA-binding transcriptional regulator AlpA
VHLSHEEAMNSPPQLIRLPEVLRLTGLSRSTVYRLEKAGCFVPRVRLGDRLAEPSSHVNWSEDDLNLAPIGGAWVAADTLARPRRTHVRWRTDRSKRTAEALPGDEGDGP